MALPAVLSLLVVLGVLLIAFRSELPHRSIHPEGPPPPVDRKLLVICSIAMAGILIAFFAGLPLSWSALVGATAVMLVAGVNPEEQYKKVDLGLLLFFACQFISGSTSAWERQRRGRPS